MDSLYRMRVINLAELKQRLLVEWRKMDHSTVVAVVSQWRLRLSACVRAHAWRHSAFWDSWFNVLN